MIRIGRFVLATMAATAACMQSAPDRSQDASERAEREAQVRASEVVQALATPREPGRIIYDRPADLSYANLRLARPDLVRPDSARRK